MSVIETKKQIRVLVANQPRLMRDLVIASLHEHSDIEVVGEVGSEFEIRDQLERLQPDCLIISSDPAAAPLAICDLLRDFPKMKVLALSSGNGSSQFFWTSANIHSRCVEPSESGVLKAVREVSTRGGNNV